MDWNCHTIHHLNRYANTYSPPVKKNSPHPLSQELNNKYETLKKVTYVSGDTTNYDV